MDQKVKNKQELNILQLMLGMSKTQLLTLNRHLKMAQKTLYTTDMRTVTLSELVLQVEQAHAYLDEKTQENVTNQMENGK